MRRQAEIAGLLAARLSDIEIAERLGISWHTVRSHVDHVFEQCACIRAQKLFTDVRRANDVRLPLRER